MTHEEAAARYPHREEFAAPEEPMAGDWGRSFKVARSRASALGLVHVEEGTGGGDDSSPGWREPDGVILPGKCDKDPSVLPRFPMLGSVTLYYRPRAEVAVAR